MVTATELNQRVEKIKSTMEYERIPALLISSPKNVEYLSGRDTGRVLLTEEEDFLWTRELYMEVNKELYSEKSYPFDVAAYQKEAVKNRIIELKIKELAIENLPHLVYEKARKDLRVKLTVSEAVDRQRAVKTSYEIELLRKSASIAKKAMAKAFDVVGAGVREIDALAEIEYEIRMQGSDATPFSDGMLLSSGPASANIHARASGRKIASGSTVVVDLGGRYESYYSDMTRTLGIEKVGALERDLLEFVDDLRARAIDIVSTEMKAADLHAFVEGEIVKKGYKFFHGTGHGVGLEIHEFPSITGDSTDVLKEGMVFTIEPGIYVPGKLGVRFEDMVLLKKGKPEVLTV